MDITAKYRTRFPPKEHEEAVKMLLDGIKVKQTSTIQQQQMVPEKKPSRDIVSDNYNNNNASGKQHKIYDNRSMSSRGSRASSDELVQMNTNVPFKTTTMSSSIMHSKATSTSESAVSCSSTSGTEHDPTYKQQIPSRTIAVQCDLKSSSVKRDSQPFDGSMQASSISSTRYGFYNFTPETLERRRKLQRSISNRDLTQNSRTAHVNQSRDRIDASQIEAPTSMSELSSSSSCISTTDNDLDGDEIVRRAIAGEAQLSDCRQRARQALSSVTNGHESRLKSGSFVKAGGRETPLRREAAMYGSVNDNSIARARVHSLPRRPMTALSYVSNNKLRTSADRRARSPDGSIESENSEPDHQQVPMKNRAMSQQALIRPQTPATELGRDAGSSSDSDLGASSRFSGSQAADKYQVPRSEEIIMRRGQTIPTKPPRPTLVSSVHNEQVCDYTTLERISARRERTADELDELDQVRGSENWRNNLNSGLGSLHTRAAASRQPIVEPIKFPRATRRVGAYDDEPEKYRSNELDNTRYRKLPVTELLEPFDSQAYSVNNESQYSDALLNCKRDTADTLNSMSLSRKPKPTVPVGKSTRNLDRYDGTLPTSGYLTAARRPSALSREGALSGGAYTPSSRDYNYANYDHQARPYHGANEYASSVASKPRDYRQTIADQGKRLSDHDNESPLTRTWANPGVSNKTRLEPRVGGPTGARLPENRMGATRSFSMRNVNTIDRSAPELSGDQHDHYYSRQKRHFYPTGAAPQETVDRLSYNSSSETSSFHNGSGSQKHFIHSSHPLDYEPQHHRLANNNGPPELNSMASMRRPAASYIGLSSAGLTRNDNLMSAQYLGGGRSSQITGRAMSQQSLTRPTMPLSSGRRRATGGGGSNASGSDVGGSSMSLVSRLHGRYENAHTRTPVVMYIPQAATKSGLHSEVGSKTSLFRKSSRSRQQDRSRRSLSRNGSDSETSSMLRTLVKPRSRMHSKRAISRNDHDEENMDCVGQLATEMDSYKFRRRYSVPKDAKFNWFAKLKQRVSSSNK